jgi:hypothetical protein
MPTKRRILQFLPPSAAVARTLNLLSMRDGYKYRENQPVESHNNTSGRRLGFFSSFGVANWFRSLGRNSRVLS